MKKPSLVVSAIAAGLVLLPATALAQTETTAPATGTVTTTAPTTTAPTTTAPTTTVPTSTPSTTSAESPVPTTTPVPDDGRHVAMRPIFLPVNGHDAVLKARRGAILRVEAGCDGTQPTISSPALAFTLDSAHMGYWFYTATVRDVAPGTYQVHYLCTPAYGPEAGTTNGYTSPFTVLAGGKGKQVAKVPVGAPQTGDGSSSGTL